MQQVIQNVNLFGIYTQFDTIIILHCNYIIKKNLGIQKLIKNVMEYEILTLQLHNSNTMYPNTQNNCELSKPTLIPNTTGGRSRGMVVDMSKPKIFSFSEGDIPLLKF